MTPTLDLTSLSVSEALTSQWSNDVLRTTSEVMSGVIDPLGIIQDPDEDLPSPAAQLFCWMIQKENQSGFDLLFRFLVFKQSTVN